ncbi:MAG TPA: hypothetical protein VF122_03320 [Caulobacteraceae bacterium]
MTDTVEHKCPTELGGILCRLFGIQRELDTPLLKRLYYGGLALMGVWGVASVMLAINLAIDSPGGGAGGFFLVSAAVGIGTVTWRLICEAVLGLLLLVTA